MLSQLFANIYHVSDSEWEQKEKISYIFHYDIIINNEDHEDENDEDEHDNLMKIEETWLIDDENIEKINKMLIMSSDFTDLLTLIDSDNMNYLVQIHDYVCQSLCKVHNMKLDNLDSTIYKIQFIQEQEFYISVCCDSKFLNWYKDDDFFSACFLTLFFYDNEDFRVSDWETRDDDKQENFELKTWAEILF